MCRTKEKLSINPEIIFKTFHLYKSETKLYLIKKNTKNCIASTSIPIKVGQDAIQRFGPVFYFPHSCEPTITEIKEESRSLNTC